MAGRKRTINRKEQRADFDEEATEKPEADEADDEEEEDEEEGEEEGEGEGDGEGEGEADAEADAEDDGGDDDDDEDGPKKKKKKVAKPKKAAAPKRARAAKKAVRQKAVWVLYDNSSKQIETFPYSERAEAEKLLTTKSEDAKKGYYLQMVKVPLDEK